MSAIKSNKGFTLIELIIVLAIGALIIAGVLLAVGGAQRSQRDQARKDTASRVGTAIQSFASNNNGTMPAAALAATYTSGILDPDTGGAPVYGTTAHTAANYATTAIQYQNARICTGAVGASTGPMIAAGASARNYAITYWSEGANAEQCIDNR